MFFSPFSIAITSIGEERANVSAFRTFIRFVLVCFCLFSLPLGVWERLRFVYSIDLVFYSTDRSKAVVPVFFCFVVYSTRRNVLCLTLCHFILVFFSRFSIAITSLREERANLSAFRTFVRFVLVWIFRFPLPLGVWEGLQFVIMDFSLTFFCDCGTPWTFFVSFCFQIAIEPFGLSCFVSYLSF